MVVLGPGTGLGQAVLTWQPDADAAGGGSYRVWPSEGSHADFAPRGPLQRALAAAAEAELGECEVEQVCCGVRHCIGLRMRIAIAPLLCPLNACVLLRSPGWCASTSSSARTAPWGRPTR
jgi:hypothetical protein